MKPMEIQDVSDYVRASHSATGWVFRAHIYDGLIGYELHENRFLGIAEASDPDFLVAATKLIVEAKRMREAAR